MTPFSAAAADDTILLWVPEATQTFTEQQIEAFKEANPDYAAHRAAIVCYALSVRKKRRRSLAGADDRRKQFPLLG